MAGGRRWCAGDWEKSGEGALPMNNLAGMRTVEAMASEEAWVAGHKAAAGMLKLSSIPFLIGGVACLVVGDSWISWISAPVVILSISIILVASSKAKQQHWRRGKSLLPAMRILGSAL